MFETNDYPVGTRFFDEDNGKLYRVNTHHQWVQIGLSASLRKRKSPLSSAVLFLIGHQKQGCDGTMWEVAQSGRWVRVKKRQQTGGRRRHRQQQQRNPMFFDAAEFLEPGYNERCYTQDEDDVETWQANLRAYLKLNDVRPGDILFLGDSYEGRQEYGFAICNADGEVDGTEAMYQPFDHWTVSELYDDIKDTFEWMAKNVAKITTPLNYDGATKQLMQFAKTSSCVLYSAGELMRRVDEPSPHVAGI